MLVVIPAGRAYIYFVDNGDLVMTAHEMDVQQVTRCLEGSKRAAESFRLAKTAAERNEYWAQMVKFDTLLARARLRLMNDRRLGVE